MRLLKVLVALVILSGSLLTLATAKPEYAKKGSPARSATSKWVRKSSLTQGSITKSITIRWKATSLLRRRKTRSLKGIGFASRPQAQSQTATLWRDRASQSRSPLGFCRYPAWRGRAGVERSAVVG
jgi:hypothetical protein